MTNVATSDEPTAAIGAYTFSLVQYRCVTPLHVGCGQDVGIVDLPVIRERTTGYPFVPGSSIRGSLREIAERRDPAMAKRLFGSSDDAEQAGCVIVTDAKILLFPVRSHPGIFHWITCPFILNRHAADAEYFTGTGPAVASVSGLTDGTYAGPQNHAPFILEEFPFGARAQAWTCPIAVDGVDSQRVVLVDDEVFSYFARSATIVMQHNHLSAAKTVLRGQLFSVESLPPETVLYGCVGATAERKEAAAMTASEVGRQLRGLLIQQANGNQHSVILGGDEGTGLGLTRVTWA